jgi:hypothetical protein
MGQPQTCKLWGEMGTTPDMRTARKTLKLITYLSSDKVVNVPVYLICIYNVVMFIQNRYSVVLFLVLNVMASLPVKKCPNCGQDMTLKSKKDRKG